MRLTTAEIHLILLALNRAAARFESEARYAKTGKGANNYDNTMDRAKRTRELCERILKASGIVLEDDGSGATNVVRTPDT